MRFLCITGVIVAVLASTSAHAGDQYFGVLVGDQIANLAQRTTNEIIRVQHARLRDVYGPSSQSFFSDPPPGLTGTDYKPNYVAPADGKGGYDGLSGEATCHEYVQSIEAGARTKDVHGTVCLQADGTWRVVQ